MKQLTEEQALKFLNSGVWRDMSDEEIVKLQLFQKRLCMPFSKFHSAIETVLGRSVWMFALQKELQDEYLVKRPDPDFNEIIQKIYKVIE